MSVSSLHRDQTVIFKPRCQVFISLVGFVYFTTFDVFLLPSWPWYVLSYHKFDSKRQWINMFFFQLIRICLNTDRAPNLPLTYLVATVFPCYFIIKHLKEFKTSISNEGRYLNKIRSMLGMKKKAWMLRRWPVVSGYSQQWCGCVLPSQASDCLV